MNTHGENSALPTKLSCDKGSSSKTNINFCLNFFKKNLLYNCSSLCLWSKFEISSIVLSGRNLVRWIKTLIDCQDTKSSYQATAYILTICMHNNREITRKDVRRDLENTFQCLDIIFIFPVDGFLFSCLSRDERATYLHLQADCRLKGQYVGNSDHYKDSLFSAVGSVMWEEV